MPSFWSRRTSIEKGLIIVVGVVTVLSVVFLATILVIILRPAASLRTGVSYIQRTAESKDDISICTTPDCIYAASKLLLDLDENVDPCHNFNDFICGSFLKNTRIPGELSSMSSVNTVRNKLSEQLRLVLEEPIKSGEPRPIMLAKTVYQACMNTTAIEARGLQPLLDLLKTLGGWPVLDGDTWNESYFSWKDSIYHFRDVGISTDFLIQFTIDIDYKNNTKHIISLGQAVLGLNMEYLIKGCSDKVVLAYYDYMVDIAKLLGADKSRAEIEMKESLQFEMNLANMSISTEQQRNLINLYNPMTIAELIRKFPSIPWLDYINRLLAPHVTVGPEEITVVGMPNYIAGLEELLTVTPKRVQANYMMWRVVQFSVSYLTDPLRHRELTYMTALSGETEHKNRWNECSDMSNNIMSIAVSALYVRKYLNEESKAIASEIFKDIKQQFRKILTEVDWMDNTTRSAALDKADSMTSHIAYAQELLDDHKLTEYYSGLEVLSNKWLESVLNLSLFEIEYTIQQLRKPYNKTDWVWHSRSAVVNAYYSLQQNFISLPAGILQPPFFSSKRPAYMNYGSIGSIIGHEITHGFDDQGRHFDKRGDVMDWWERESSQKFSKKAKCLIDQYSNYTVIQVGLKLNGNHTLGENIADNGGIKQAYYAYQAWTKRHGEEPRLPGLEKYTPNQLFWFSFANMYCHVFRDEHLKMIIILDSHTPGPFRIIGISSNMEEFSKDFKCPTDTQMNPQKKCEVW